MQGRDGRLHVTAGGQGWLLPSDEVAEIIRVPTITTLPHAPECLLGLANLRGVVLPVVCLATLLGHRRRETARKSRVVVLSGVSTAGLLVEDVASSVAEGAPLEPRALLASALAAPRRSAPAGHAGIAAGQERSAPARALRTLIGIEVGGQDYAIGMTEVAEILRLPPAAEWGAVPHTDAAMLGIIGFRGGVLPMVSLAVLLGLDAAPAPARGVVIVVRLGAGWAGLVADGVRGNFTIEADALDPVPRLLTRASGEALLEGICRLEDGRKLVGLLDVQKLFDPRSLSALRDAGSPPAAAEPKASAAEARFVLFEVGGTRCGLPIGAVGEVVRCAETLARPPFLPDFLLGVLSLRGRTVPVIDMAERLGAAPGPSSGRRVIVVGDGERQAGLAVDAVRGVLGVAPADLRPAPAATAKTEGLFDRVALRPDGGMVLLVAPAFVLAQAERDLSGAASGRITARQSVTS